VEISEISASGRTGVAKYLIRGNLRNPRYLRAINRTRMTQIWRMGADIKRISSLNINSVEISEISTRGRTGVAKHKIRENPHNPRYLRAINRTRRTRIRRMDADIFKHIFIEY